MANVLIYRGGSPDFKGVMCDNQFAEYRAPYSAPHLAATPPFDSHADAAYGQGYLNLNFPLVPNLNDTSAHRWMQPALKGIKDVDDIIFTNWVPTFSYMDALHIVVTATDPTLDGVYFKPVAYRHAWNFTTEEWTLTPIVAFDDEVAAAGVTQFPLGTPQAGDDLYGLIRLSTDPTVLPSTFGHNLKAPMVNGSAPAPLDAYFGNVLIGLQIVAGDPDNISKIWKSNIAVYVSGKLLSFECPTQVG